jgi:predicted nucleotidyltransferase
MAMYQKREEILSTLQNHLPEIQHYHVKKLGLFGSHAQGAQTETSDLDFIVEFSEKSFDNYMDLKLYLEDLFRKPVDLVISSSIKPRLRSEILNNTVYAQGL